MALQWHWQRLAVRHLPRWQKVAVKQLPQLSQRLPEAIWAVLHLPQLVQMATKLVILKQMRVVQCPQVLHPRVVRHSILSPRTQLALPSPQPVEAVVPVLRAARHEKVWMAALSLHV